MELTPDEKRELNTLAAKLYLADWPNANWFNHFPKDPKTKVIDFTKPDLAGRRYRSLADVAKEHFCG